MSEQIIIEMLRQHLERNTLPRNQNTENWRIESQDRLVLNDIIRYLVTQNRRDLIVEGLSPSDQIHAHAHAPIDQPRHTNVRFHTPHHDHTNHPSSHAENDSRNSHSENHIPRSSLNFPEFDELMYLYHRNVQEYQYTVQEMTERIELNHRRNTRQQNTLLDNFVYPYHRNMQEYNQVTLRCLDVLQNLNALHVTRPTPQNNTQVPVDVASSFANPTPLPSRPANTEVRNGMRNRNIIPEIFNMSRPIEYGFTFYPDVVPRNVITPQPTNHLLTPAQIALTTREYTFQESDRNLLNTIPVCPIMLEEFQVGNNIREIVHCGHQFLSSSLERWFRRSCCCPICRYNLWDISATEPNRTTRTRSRFAETLSPAELVVGGFQPPDRSRANSMVDQDRLLGTEPLRSLPPSSQRIMDIPLSTSLFSQTRSPFRTTSLPRSENELGVEGFQPSDQDFTNRTITIPGMVDVSNTDTNLESIAETTIRNWISSFLHNQPNQFPNIDLDISYTVEYDYQDGSNNSV